MKALRKVVPPSRVILDDIWLSFFPGAKIGVLGANGAGKSTLLRIMAGVDQDFQGDARPTDGIRIGYLAQEPALDPAKDVRGNVEEAVREQRALLPPRLLDVAAHVLGGIQRRLLGQVTDPDAIGGAGVALEVLVDAGHDAEQGALAGAVGAEHADLRAGKE